METITIHKTEKDDRRTINRKLLKITFEPNIINEGDVILNKNKEIEDKIGGGKYCKVYENLTIVVGRIYHKMKPNKNVEEDNTMEFKECRNGKISKKG